MRVSFLLQSSDALARVSSMRAFTHDDLLLHLWPLHCIWDGVAWRRVQSTNFFQYPIKHLMILMACARALCASAWLRYLDKGRSGMAGNSRHGVCNGPPNFAALIAGATSNTIKIWMQWIIMGKDYELSVSRRWSEDNADHEGFRFLYVHGGRKHLVGHARRKPRQTSVEICWNGHCSHYGKQFSRSNVCLFEVGSVA
jgi:hypothetical protein